MSETDSFIEEVTEEVRRDRLWGYVRRFGWIAVVIVLLVVGFTGWNEYRKATDAAAAQELGDKIVAAGEISDAEQQAEALASLSSEAGAASVLVDLRRASALVEADDADGALAIYDQISASSIDAVYADLASLKALMLRGDALPVDERLTALDGLAVPGAPYRPLALEQKAVALIDAARTEEAIAVLNEILDDSQTTAGLRNRSLQLVIALGGEPSTTPRLLSEE